MDPMEKKHAASSKSERTMEQLLDEAKRLNIDGATHMSKSELEQAIKRHLKRHS